MICGVILTLLSLSADLRWVEVDVSLWQDGRADFVYKVRWNEQDQETELLTLILKTLMQSMPMATDTHLR